MQEVKYRVVRKMLNEIEAGDLLCASNKEVFEILKVDYDHNTNPFRIKHLGGRYHWPDDYLLEQRGVLNSDSTYNVMDLIKEDQKPCCPHTEIRNGADNSVKGIIFNGETYTKEEPEQPTPETRTIEIDGQRFTVTRERDGWSKPEPWVLTVGDEVKLSDLSEGDLVMVPGVIHDQAGEMGRIGVRLPHSNDCVKWFRASDTVIYNGRAE